MNTEMITVGELSARAIAHIYNNPDRYHPKNYHDLEANTSDYAGTVDRMLGSIPDDIFPVQDIREILGLTDVEFANMVDETNRVHNLMYWHFLYFFMDPVRSAKPVEVVKDFIWEGYPMTKEVTKITITASELSARAIAWIQEHSENWDQTQYHNMGRNKSCWAGTIDRMLGADPLEDSRTGGLVHDVRAVLNMPRADWYCMVFSGNTLDDLKYYHAEYIEGKLMKPVEVVENFTW